MDEHQLGLLIDIIKHSTKNSANILPVQHVIRTYLPAVGPSVSSGITVQPR